MCVRGSHMQLLHMLRRCSPQVEKEKDWACGTSTVCANAARLHACTCCFPTWNIMWSVCGCSFMHKQTPSVKYVQMPCDRVDFSSLDQRWHFSCGVTAFASQWRTTQGPPFRNPGSIREGQQEPPSPLNVQLPVLSESSMSTMECLTSWDMVKRKPPGTTGGPATAQHLHHVGWMCTHRKEAFLHVPFLISTGKPGPLC